MMKSFRVRCSSIVVAALGISLSSASADDPSPVETSFPTIVRRALILAPGKYTRLKPSPFHTEGAELLRSRLKGAGFAEEHIALLTATEKNASRKATAANFLKQLATLRDDAGADDVVVVFVASYLRSAGGETYICASDSDPAELAAARLSARPKSFVSMSQVIDLLEGSAAMQRVVLVDAAEVAAEKNRSVSFVTKNALPAGMWTITSTSHATCGEKADRLRTWFLQSLLDGLTERADGNSNGSVSLFELTDYLQQYAEIGNYTSPIVQGKTNRDIELAVPVPSLGDRESLRPELQAQIIEKLVDSAKYELLREKNPASALRALQRALSYQPAPEQKTEIENLRNTAIAATGEVLDAWKRAAASSNRLQLYANAPVVIQVPFKTTGRHVPEGVYLTIEGTSDDGLWFWVTGAVQASSGAGRIRFQGLEIEKGWLSVKSAVAASKGPANAALGRVDRPDQAGRRPQVAER